MTSGLSCKGVHGIQRFSCQHLPTGYVCMAPLTLGGRTPSHPCDSHDQEARISAKPEPLTSTTSSTGSHKQTHNC